MRLLGYEDFPLDARHRTELNAVLAQRRTVRFAGKSPAQAWAIGDTGRLLLESHAPGGSFRPNQVVWQNNSSSTLSPGRFSSIGERTDSVRISSSSTMTTFCTVESDYTLPQLSTTAPSVVSAHLNKPL